MPKRRDDDTEIERTYDKDMLFLQSLRNDMNSARQSLAGLEHNFSTIDPLTLGDRLRRVHILVTIDLYNRMKSLSEPRGYLTDLEYDIYKCIAPVRKISQDDPLYYSSIIDTYYVLLARYDYWLDKLGILLQNEPPNIYVDSILEGLEQELSSERLRRKRRGTVDE